MRIGYLEETEWILEYIRDHHGATNFTFTNEDGEMWAGLEDCAYQVNNHEMGWVWFDDPTNGEKKRRGIFFVAGNSTGEIVCDYTCHRILPYEEKCCIGQAIRAFENWYRAVCAEDDDDEKMGEFW